MRRSSRAGVLWVALVLAALPVPVYAADQSATPPAPVPSQITGARKAFVANAQGKNSILASFFFLLSTPPNLTMRSIRPLKAGPASIRCRRRPMPILFLKFASAPNSFPVRATLAATRICEWQFGIPRRMFCCGLFRVTSSHRVARMGRKSARLTSTRLYPRWSVT